MAALGFLQNDPDVLKLHFFSYTCEEGIVFFDCPFDMLRGDAGEEDCYIYEEEYDGQVDESDLNPSKIEVEMWIVKAENVTDFLQDMTMGRQKAGAKLANACAEASKECTRLKNYAKKLKEENKGLKEEVIAERKKVAESEEGWRFSMKMWGAEADFLKMESAKVYPKDFNDFLKDVFDEETYKKMYDEFELEELLEEDEEESEDEE